MEIQIDNSPGQLKISKKTLSRLIHWLVQQLALDVTSTALILTDDNALRDLHKLYLDDDSFTDVMTFNLSDNESIEAEIYISTDRVQEQASRFKTTVSSELMRLIIHAFLHLAGYDDRTQTDRKRMKAKEEDFLFQVEQNFLHC